MHMSSSMTSGNGYDMIDFGGTVSGLKDFVNEYTSGAAQPAKYASAFFCRSSSHANAMVKCIQNNYQYLTFSWVDFWSDAMNPKSTSNKRTITSVTNLGKCSDIGYKIYYTSDKYYDFSANDKYKDLYVVEILTNNYLYCSVRKGSNCMPVVIFS